MEGTIMHVTSRMIRVASGASMNDAIGQVNQILGHLNSTHGSEFGAGIQLGGDAQVIGITGRFESLADYEALRAAMGTDEVVQSLIRVGDSLFDNTIEDTIWKSRIAPSEPELYSTVASANIALTRVGDAMAFAAEITATVSEILGKQGGLATAVTGDRSRVVWVGNAASLAEVEESGDKLEASAEYMDLFKRSEGLIVPNTLQQNIWQRVTS